jgi:uncharacterized protein YoxC
MMMTADDPDKLADLLSSTITAKYTWEDEIYEKTRKMIEEIEEKAKEFKTLKKSVEDYTARVQRYQSEFNLLMEEWQNHHEEVRKQNRPMWLKIKSQLTWLRLLIRGAALYYNTIM